MTIPPFLFDVRTVVQAIGLTVLIVWGLCLCVSVVQRAWAEHEQRIAEKEEAERRARIDAAFLSVVAKYPTLAKSARLRPGFTNDHHLALWQDRRHL
jgi:hypothetical protein